ncbi:DNA-binding response regulator [Marinilabiliaceae bacterium JC017]|nr:DNA-binding response regulator [Marinilabiliaceae bacterium JC017]
MERILIVEDEPDMQAGLKDNLEFEGYEVDVAGDGEAGLSALLNNNYSLVLLDVMLPKLSGFEVCKRVRKQDINTPIIFLTAKGEEIDKVIGLESGGDDYITKPFSLRELLARVKAVLRRSGAVADSGKKETTLTIGRLKVDFSAFNAWNDGQPVKMTVKEFEILHHLWNSKNMTVTRDSLLDNIWGDDYQPTTRTIDNFILKLRHKIEEDPNHPQIVMTVHGIGYRLVY